MEKLAQTSTRLAASEFERRARTEKVRAAKFAAQFPPQPAEWAEEEKIDPGCGDVGCRYCYTQPDER